MVIWIIGKSGSGKTFLGKKLYLKIKKKIKKTIWLDGDKFRKKYSKDLGYKIRDRKINSERIQNFCKKYDKKKYIIICSIISIFKSHQKRNRKIFKNYFQIYIQANNKKLISRNKKKIYSKKRNVVGKDIKFPTPVKSDLIIKNNFNRKFLKNISKIENFIYEKI
jgi:adenylylsulfate kinase|tara:strand:- start:3435 stop:3929 length:495 start_codon:yes stop_codon:yes gene_type:complete